MEMRTFLFGWAACARHEALKLDIGENRYAKKTHTAPIWIADLCLFSSTPILHVGTRFWELVTN